MHIARYKRTHTEAAALARISEGLAMKIRRKPTQPSTLVQQQSDYTAEGSSPPGNVATSTPTTTPKVAASPAPRRASPARKGPMVGRSRWQR
jgi:hypothetical protein